VQDKLVAYQRADQALQLKRAVMAEKRAAVEVMAGVDEDGLRAQLDALQRDSSEARWRWGWGWGGGGWFRARKGIFFATSIYICGICVNWDRLSHMYFSRALLFLSLSTKLQL
jgi:hypothetical protein